MTLKHVFYQATMKTTELIFFFFVFFGKFIAKFNNVQHEQLSVQYINSTRKEKKNMNLYHMTNMVYSNLFHESYHLIHDLPLGQASTLYWHFKRPRIISANCSVDSYEFTQSLFLTARAWLFVQITGKAFCSDARPKIKPNSDCSFPDEILNHFEHFYDDKFQVSK